MNIRLAMKRYADSAQLGTIVKIGIRRLNSVQSVPILLLVKKPALHATLEVLNAQKLEVR